MYYVDIINVDWADDVVSVCSMVDDFLSKYGKAKIFGIAILC